MSDAVASFACQVSPSTALLRGLDTGADVVTQPQVAAAGVDLLVPGEELVQRNAGGGVDGPAAVARLDLVVRLAVADDARHLGRRA